MEYYSALIKERDPVICDNTDEPGAHYVEWNKPDKDKYCIVWFIYTIFF